MRMEWDNNSEFSIEGPKFLRTVKPLKNSKGVDFAQLEVRDPDHTLTLTSFTH